jgi:hypothetical protein
LSDSSLYFEAAVAASLLRALVWLAVALVRPYWSKVAKGPAHNSTLVEQSRRALHLR